MNKQLNNQPLVSIIMNCFNGEKYLNEALSSILNQSYNFWEIIFWDNQSNDSSAKIFNSYKDKRFKYFYAKKHTSLYEARNLAIEESKGELIAFLDTDDLWEKNKLELQVPFFSNKEVGVVYSNLWMIKKDIRKKKLYKKKILPSGKIYSNLIYDYSVGILTTVIRKRSYLSLKKKFDHRFSIVGDFDLFLRLSKICLFQSIQEPLAYYRLHGLNLSIINKKKEIQEFELWLRENKFNLNKNEVNRLQKKIDQRKFVNYKIDGKYKECIYMLFNFKNKLISIKNLILFFTPATLLIKLLHYHQDYNDSN